MDHQQRKPRERRATLSRRVLLSGLASLPVPAWLLASSARAQNSSGHLPSWNEGPAKQAIFDFVRTTTDRTGDPTLAALHLAPVSTQTKQMTTVEDQKEWRITFRSADAPPPLVGSPRVIQTSVSVPIVSPPPAAVVRPPTPAGLPAAPIPVDP